MSQVATSSTLGELLESLVLCLDAESMRRLIEFRISDKIQDRVTVLAEGANEGLLTPEENSEYGALIDTADLISIMKLKARRILESHERR